MEQFTPAELVTIIATGVLLGCALAVLIMIAVRGYWRGDHK